MQTLNSYDLIPLLRRVLNPNLELEYFLMGPEPISFDEDSVSATLKDLISGRVFELSIKEYTNNNSYFNGGRI